MLVPHTPYPTPPLWRRSLFQFLITPTAPQGLRGRLSGIVLGRVRSGLGAAVYVVGAPRSGAGQDAGCCPSCGLARAALLCPALPRPVLPWPACSPACIANGQPGPVVSRPVWYGQAGSTQAAGSAALVAYIKYSGSAQSEGVKERGGGGGGRALPKPPQLPAAAKRLTPYGRVESLSHGDEAGAEGK